MQGWILIDKPIGPSSNHINNYIKKKFNIKKAGFAGTLDPLASGLLPIAIGKSTKEIQKLMTKRKAYTAKILWGEKYDTDDVSGKLIAKTGITPTEDSVKKELLKLTGEIEQTPPIYSAIKIDGKRSYKLAREGQNIKSMPKRLITIYKTEYLGKDKNTTNILVECSTGTYIRSIARDMGDTIGCLGTIKSIRRIYIGKINVKDAWTIDEIEKCDNILDMIMPTIPSL